MSICSHWYGGHWMTGKNWVLSRRWMLRAGVGSLTFGALPQASFSAGRGHERSLVCIYLFGGNDGNNLIVPMDGVQYDTYAKARGSLALSGTSLLPLKGNSYGLHPAL